MGRASVSPSSLILAFYAVLLLAVHFTARVSAIVIDRSRLERQEKLIVRLPDMDTADPTNADPVRAPTGCTRTPVIVVAGTEEDLYGRLQYVNKTTVYLLISGDITLSKPLNMSGDEWSCTSIRPLNPGVNPQLEYKSDLQPAVLFWRTNNVFFYGIDVRIAATESSPACLNMPDFSGVNSCPAVFIWQSYGIDIAAGSVYGRTDVIASTTVHIDSMTLFAPGLQGANQALYPGSVSCPGVVRFSYCGNAQNLIRSDNIISNSDISGNSIGVLLYYMAVGITIRNNEIHNFSVMGIQCGMNVHNVADCMLNTFTHNLIYTEPFVKYWGDGAGIYFNTHWVNPANYVSCNHIVGGKHCIYIDYASSGVRVEGGICERTQDGVKINNGKNNVVTGIVHKNITWTVGIISCQNPSANNCLTKPGSYWMEMYWKYYNTQAWNQIAPWLSRLCDQTSYNGFQCNPPNTLGSDPWFTGNCSGLPTGNSVEYIIVDGTRYNPPYYGQCSNYTTVPNMNPMKIFPITGSLAGFDDMANSDFGVSDYTSPIYSMLPKFKSCPKSSIGIQRAEIATLNSQMQGFDIQLGMAQEATTQFKAIFKAEYRAAEFNDYSLLVDGN